MSLSELRVGEYYDLFDPLDHVWTRMKYAGTKDGWIHFGGSTHSCSFPPSWFSYTFNPRPVDMPTVGVDVSL